MTQELTVSEIQARVAELEAEILVSPERADRLREEILTLCFDEYGNQLIPPFGRPEWRAYSSMGR